MLDLERQRRRLEALREELDGWIQDTRQGAQPVDLDAPIGRVSRIDAIQQREMVAANRTAAARRRQQVEAALRRLDDGEYGDCVSCEEPIGVRRLEVHPEAPLCIACQQQRER